MADIPQPVRRGIPEFHYEPGFILEGEDEKIFIGDRMFGFAVHEASMNGGDIVGKIPKIIDALARRKKAFDIEKITLRRVISIETIRGAGNGLDKVNFKGTMAKYDLSKNDVWMQLMVDKKSNGVFHTIQMKSEGLSGGAVTGGSKNGLLKINIATEKKPDHGGFWSDSAKAVKQLHVAERAMLGKLMKKSFR